MSFFSDMFSASGANRRQQQQSDQLQRQLDQSRGVQRNDLTAGRDRALGMVNPYIQSGQRGQTAYEDTLGLNGAPARQRAFQTGYLDDPALAYRNQNNQLQMNQLYRKYNAGGQGINSGAATLGAGRLATEQFNNDWGGYQNRLQGLGQQGQQAAQFGAGLEFQTGQGLAGVERDANQLTSTNMINNWNAQNQNRANAGRNILGAAGLVGNFLMPGAGGVSAAGNMFGGINNMISQFGNYSRG